MKVAASWLLVIAGFVCGTGAANPPAVRRSPVPPPNPVSLIPAPAYAFDSGVTNKVDSLFRPNADLQAPGMNLYRASPSEHLPTMFSIERMDRWRFIDPTDMAATEAYVIGAYGESNDRNYSQRVSDAGANWLRHLLRVDYSTANEDRLPSQGPDSTAIRIPAVPYWYFPCNARMCAPNP